MLKMFHNAHFFLDSGFDNSVIGLLVEDNMIIKLIKNRQPLPTDIEKIDLRGGFVYPGFIDSHTHCFSGGLYLGGVDLACCSSIGDILDRIREAVKEEDSFVLAWHFDETKIKENRFPTLRELDAISPNNPLLLRRIDGHSCILNTKARSMVSGLNFKEEIISGKDNDFVVNQLQDTSPPQTIFQAYTIAAQAAMLGGFTTVHTMIGDAQNDNQHYRLISDDLERFPIRFELYPQIFNIDNAIDLGARRIGGCILADGSIGSYTAAMSLPYAEKQTYGVLYHDQEYWDNFIAKAHNRGLQVCVHCIGDAAVKQINNAFRKLERSEVQELRHELIHCEVTPDALIEEIVESGAVPVMQPNFDLLWGGKHGLYEQRLGAVRSRQMNRFASFARKGVRICGSSDWYVTDMNIAMSLHACIHHHNPDERLTPQEAISVYTKNNTWLNKEEHLFGEIAPGFVADLSVMDTDFTKPFDYKKSATMFIVSRGKVVYASS